MNKANYFIFRCSSSKKKIWCLYFLKVPQSQREDEWNFKRRKDTNGESPKKGTELSNQHINKLTLLYFNSFCQPFYIPFYYNIFDQRLFCYYEKLFQPVRKNFIKIKI